MEIVLNTKVSIDDITSKAKILKFLSSETHCIPNWQDLYAKIKRCRTDKGLAKILYKHHDQIGYIDECTGELLNHYAYDMPQMCFCRVYF